MNSAKCIALLVSGLSLGGVSRAGSIDYRAEMVGFVAAIAERARATNAAFGIIAQNASELGAYSNHVETVTAISQEDIYYGYDGDGVATNPDDVAYLETNLDAFKAGGRPVFTLNYPFKNKKKASFSKKTVVKIHDAYARSLAKGYIPYATVRELNALVVNPGHEPATNVPAITNWSQIAEWCVQLQPVRKQTRPAFLTALGASKFDMVVIDYSFDGSGDTEFTTEEIAALKDQLGGKVVAYLSIGEAEDYRWYWQSAWKNSPPAWLGAENPDWRGNFKVHYWDANWQAIIFAYLDKILGQGFDGVYLDLVDAYESYESLQQPPPPASPFQ